MVNGNMPNIVVKVVSMIGTNLTWEEVIIASDLLRPSKSCRLANSTKMIVLLIAIPIKLVNPTKPVNEICTPVT